MNRSATSVDSHLLRVLVTLVSERNVSRTAIRLSQSQPAISTALKRLREIFADPLLVRQRAGMAPTDRALLLCEQARRALAEIDAMHASVDRFDPASSTQTFKLGSPDFLVSSFLAGVVEELRQSAPQARLIVQPLSAEFDHERALASGDLDLVISNGLQPPPHLHLSLLLEDDLVCLLGANHPNAATGLTREQYMASRHIVPMPYVQGQRSVVEAHLSRLRLLRDACVVVPYFELAPHLLINTDLVFTTARHFASHYARLLPLAVSDAPFDFPRMRFYQLWHERSHLAAPHRWFRKLVQSAARCIGASHIAPDG